jgi:uncharacterized phosphosugar-binding protein
MNQRENRLAAVHIERPDSSAQHGKETRMLVERYFEALQAKIAEIAARPEPIRQAARLCADALANGGVIHVFDSGHLISRELLFRAGGLAALSNLDFSLNIGNVVRTRAALPDDPALSFGYIQHVFASNQLRKGDVLFVGSVSGKTANVIELALQGRGHGLTVIAVTALAYSPKLASDHPSEKHLYEVADLALDNGAPYGDAMLMVEGLPYPICPASGIGAATVMWAVMAGVVEEMLARGLTPTVFPSVNLPDGKTLVDGAVADALRKGY